MDAVLLDEWHAHQAPKHNWSNRSFAFPAAASAISPCFWAPAEVAPQPCLSRAYVTFGCFNNTAKLNDSVFDVWAKVLAAVPDARLVLKWRTFNDEGLRQSVLEAFAQRGLHPNASSYVGPSFHVDLLKEYADIDIALDPFPFTGGLTSCEALGWACRWSPGRKAGSSAVRPMPSSRPLGYRNWRPKMPTTTCALPLTSHKTETA